MSESKGFILKAEQYNQEEWCEMFRRVSETCKDLRTENECLQIQLQQKENKEKEIRKYMKKISEEYMHNENESIIARKILEILDKEVN